MGDKPYTVKRIRAQGVPYTRLQAAINLVCEIAPRRELPGVGETDYPVIPREKAPDFLEALRLALGMRPVTFYTKLAEGWYLVRDEKGKAEGWLDDE